MKCDTCQQEFSEDSLHFKTQSIYKQDEARIMTHCSVECFRRYALAIGPIIETCLDMVKK